MKTVNIHEAKTHLSKLLHLVEKGEPFIIARAGKPLAKVEAYKEKLSPRIGFMKGKISVPDDFDTMFATEIEEMFEGKYDGSGLFEKHKPFAGPKKRRFGTLRGQFVVPDDIDTPFAKEIEEMFYGSSELDAPEIPK